MRAAPVCLASLVLLGAPLAAAQRAPLARAAISQEATSLSPAATPPSQVAPSPSDAALRIPPLPNRVDSVLPSWLRVGGEFRERFEGFDNGNFIDGRDDYYALSRVRVNAMVTASSAGRISHGEHVGAHVIRIKRFHRRSRLGSSRGILHHDHAISIGEAIEITLADRRNGITTWPGRSETDR